MDSERHRLLFLVGQAWYLVSPSLLLFHKLMGLGMILLVVHRNWFLHFDIEERILSHSLERLLLPFFNFVLVAITLVSILFCCYCYYYSRLLTLDRREIGFIPLVENARL